MSTGELLGVSVLELRTDQLPLDRGLAEALRKVGVAGGQLQMLMDRSLLSVGASTGRVGSQIDQGLTAPLVRARVASKATGEQLASSMAAAAAASKDAALKLSGYELQVRSAQARVDKLSRAVKSGKGDQAAMNDALQVAQARLSLAQGRMESYATRASHAGAETRSLSAATGVSARAFSDLTSRMGPAGRALDDLSTRSRLYRTHGVDYLAAGVVGLEGAFIGLSVRAAIRFEDLGRTVTRETGLTGGALEDLMGTIRRVARDSPYQMSQVSDAAVILRQEFHLTDAQIGRTANEMVAFATAAGSDVRPQMQQLSRIMTEYRQPLGNVVALTDRLVGVSQATQQPIGSMTDALDKFGPKLQALGFNLDDSVKLLALFSASGIKADQMGRGLASALTNATKAGTANTKMLADGPAKLDAYRLAVESAQLRVDRLSRAHITGANTQADLNTQMAIAQGKLTEAKGKYDTLNTALATAKKGHTDIATSIHSEIAQIVNAKSKQDAMNIAVADFGKNLGPSMARAYYNNQAALTKVDAALHKTGQTQRLFGVDQASIAGKTQEAKNNFQDLEITVGTKLLPALSSLLSTVRGGVHDIDTFVQHNQTLVEVLGGVAGGLSAITLLSRHSPLGNLLGAAVQGSGKSKLRTGIAGVLTGGGSGSSMFGVRGPVAAGSAANPVAVALIDGGIAGVGASAAPGTIASKEAKVAEGAVGGSALSKAAGVAKGLGVATLVIEAGNVLLPQPKTVQGIPTGQNSALGQFHNMGDELNRGFKDLLHGNLGGAAKDAAHFLGFGKDSLDSLRSFGDELKKMGNPLDITQSKLHQLHDTALKLGNDPSLSKWKPQLELVAKAFDPVKLGLQKVQFAFDFTRKGAGKSMTQIVNFTQEGAQQIGLVLAGDSATAGKALAKNYAIAVQDVRQSMKSGVIATQAGMREIDKLLAGELKALGMKVGVNAPTAADLSAIDAVNPGSSQAYVQWVASGGSGQGGGAGSAGVQPGAHYTGGKVTRPGYFAGEEAPQHPEYILAINPAYRKRNLALWAAAGGELGIPGFVQGGWVRTGASIDPTGGQAPTFSAHGGMSFAELLEAGTNAGLRPDATQLLSEPRGAYGMPMETPILARRAGGGQAYRIWKNDVGSGQGGNRHYTIDLHSRIASLLGVPGLGDIEIARDGTAAAAPVSGSGDAGPAPTIPRVLAKGAAGLVGKIAQGVLDKMRAAANAKLAAAAPAGGPGGPGGGGATSGPPGLTTFEGVTMAKWIADELIWATRHGWHGQPTSGYRPGFDPHAPSGSEHALIDYPGGAVDFGGFTDPAALATKSALVALAARLNYPGPRLMMPIGFHDDGHLSGTGHFQGGIHGYSSGARRPATPKAKTVKPPKLIKAPKPKTPPKPPGLKALAGFDNELVAQIDRLDQITVPELGNWQSYLLSLHSQLPVSPTVTLPDGSTVTNWGSEHAPLGALTGMIDPATRAQTKGIWDRVREIGGLTGSPDPLAPDRNTELGVDESLLDYLLSEQQLAGVASRELGPWLFTTTGQVAAEAAQIAWLTQALDASKGLPAESGLFASLGSELVPSSKPIGGHRKAVSQPVAQRILAYARDLKNSFAAIKRWKTIKQDLPLVKAKREAKISQRFAAARHRLANASTTGTFTASQLHTEQSAQLAAEEQDALKGVPANAPKDWLGDGYGWATQRATEHGQISKEFAARRQALATGFAGQRMQGQLSRSNALFALSSNEASEKLALSQRYGYEAIDLENLITGRTAQQSTDKTYLNSILKQITANLTTDQASLDAATTTGGFADKLHAYLDPYGTLSLGILQKQTIDIPGLLREAAALQGTTTPPGPAGTTSDSVQAGLLQQQLTEAHQALAVSQAQYKVLANMPPFAGSYATGGVVPGPAGMPRTIIAHGGEKYLGVDENLGSHIQVVVLDGAVDPNKIRVIANDEAIKVTHGQSRNAGRALPGGGGGLVRLQ